MFPLVLGKALNCFRVERVYEIDVVLSSLWHVLSDNIVSENAGPSLTWRIESDAVVLLRVDE